LSDYAPPIKMISGGLGVMGLAQALRLLLEINARGVIRNDLSRDLKEKDVFQDILATNKVLNAVTTVPPLVLPGINVSLRSALALKLNEIPSQTTETERKLLFTFFATIWNGQGDVIEVGPFLGGTSRAIALGMIENPRYEGGNLITFDRFESYIEPERLRHIIANLKEKKLIPEQISIEENGSFQKVFSALHLNTDYGNIIIPRSCSIPDLPSQVESSNFCIDESISCSAFFVDGCKSWYGTKTFMKECCKIAKPGSWFIYQDYIRHTCFWLPNFSAQFSDYFSLCAYVDDTYIFQLTKLLPPHSIEKYFPDTPELMGKEKLCWLFNSLLIEATNRSDNLAVFRHGIQYGAALAYIGEKELAHEWFDALKKGSMSDLERTDLNEASRSPTYRPGGWGGLSVEL
jgi:hypothetical protein